MATERKYRYYRGDFGPLDTRPLHLDLHFDLLEDRAVVTQRVTMRHEAAAPISTLQLNCKELKVGHVMRLKASTLGDSKNFVDHVQSFKDPVRLEFDVDTANHFLVVHLDKPVQQGEEFTLETLTTAVPTENTLEGIYYDYTPAGCPRTMITQCQQWGFQRIAPSIDTMTAKAYYTTTIVADIRYTNIITNGDLAPDYCDANGQPVFGEVPDSFDSREAGITRKKIVYYNHKVNMAPYLFFLGVGTYVTYTRELEYPDGHAFNLELLVFPELVKPANAREALNALHDSVMWTYLSTGPEQYEHEAERAELYRLIEQRETLKARARPLITDSASPAPAPAALSRDDEKALRAVRQQCRDLIGRWGNTGYKYTGQIYREISMRNSDYGGMENVGNTTIIASRIVPADHISDVAYIYMEAVKAHEFYHNINGSQVTGQSPFEIWLNEAVTVHIERQRTDALFGSDYDRLTVVQKNFYPGSGPLAVDTSPNSMAIEPEGFNRTQELISGMTYSKAPEFVRMVEHLVGPAVFVRGLHNYHTKFSFSNATTRDWVCCMEEASGLKLQDMADGWLQRTGYPQVNVKATTHDAGSRTYRVELEQTGFENKPAGKNGPWDFPVEWALVKDGKNTHEGVFRFHTAHAVITVPDVKAKPDFVSLARGWSFFGTLKNSAATPDVLRLQALSDPDVVNQYFAYRAIADQQKAGVVEALRSKNRAVTVSKDYVDLHARLLFDESRNPAARAITLSEPEALPSHPELRMWYAEIGEARTALLQAVWQHHHKEVVARYMALQGADRPGPIKDGIQERALKRHLFTIIEAGARPGVLTTYTAPKSDVNAAALAADLVFKSHYMSDKQFGFAAVLRLNAPDRLAVKERVRDMWAKHPDTWETYIMVISGVDADDAPRLIRELLEDKAFDMNLAGHARALSRMWAAIPKRSLLTPEGLDLTTHLLVRIAKVNEMSADALVHAFGDINKLPPETQTSLVAALRKAKSQLDPVGQQSVYNNLRVLLEPWDGKAPAPAPAPASAPASAPPASPKAAAPSPRAAPAPASPKAAPKAAAPAASSPRQAPASPGSLPKLWAPSEQYAAAASSPTRSPAASPAGTPTARPAAAAGSAKKSAAQPAARSTGAASAGTATKPAPSSGSNTLMLGAAVVGLAAAVGGFFYYRHRH